MSGAVLVWLVTWTSRAATLTVISTIVLRLARRTNASTRYMAWWITLVGVLALAVIPWSWPIVPESAFGSEEASPATLLGASPGRSRFGLVEIPPVPIWIVGVGAVLWAAYSARRLTALVRSLARLRVVKRRCAPVPRRFEQRLSLWISVRHEGRSARLCLSEDVATGCMLGLGPPVIALPRGLVAALTDADLDRVVLHECGASPGPDAECGYSAYLVCSGDGDARARRRRRAARTDSANHDRGTGRRTPSGAEAGRKRT